jgi:hypothetical protein
MAAYKTGRSRTLSVTGDITGRVRYELLPGPSLKTNVFNITLWVDWLADAMLTANIVAGATSRVINCDNAYGSSDADTHNTLLTDASLSGSFEFSVDVEEWVTYSEGASAPTYGGAAVDGDVPGDAVATFEERTKNGGTITATLTLNSRTVTATDTLSSEEVIKGEYRLHVEIAASSAKSDQDARVRNVAYLGLSTPVYSKSGGGAAIYTDGADTYVTTDDRDSCTGSIVMEAVPPQGFDIAGQLRADNAAYTAGGTVRVRRKAGEAYADIGPTGGSYSGSVTQQTHAMSGYCDVTLQDSVTLAEHTSPVYHWLVPPDGENVNQWRLLIRGAYYDLGTITQAATVALDGDYSFGDTGSVRTFLTAVSMAGYRYLLVDTNQAASAVQLDIGAKSWTVTTNATGLATFDLCGPGNLAVTTDARDSRWPIPTVVDTVSGDGAMWGVVNVAEYTLTAEAGVTCVVPADGVYLSRDTWTADPEGHSLLNVVAPHLYWAASGTANQYKRPLLRGDTDGRRSLDEADWTRTVGTPTTHAARTLDNLIDDVNASDTGVVRNPGWTAVLDAGIDVADGAEGSDWEYGLLNRNRNASWCEGSGIAYVAGEWRYALDVDVSDSYTLVAQMLVDKVDIYPMCGDVFGLLEGAERWRYGTTGEEGRAIIKGGRYMRGASMGLVLTTVGLPYEAAPVTLKELPAHTNAGVGESDKRGEYLTGTPWGRAGYSHQTLASVGATPPRIDGMVYGGTRLRRCFAVTPTGGLGAIEADGPRQWLHVGFESRVRTYNLWRFGLLQESGEYAVESWLKLRTDPRRGSLLMLGDVGDGTLKLYVSYDSGLTAGTPDTMTATSAAIEVDSERGIWVVVWENGANIRYQRSGDGGDTWSAAADVNYNGGALAGTVVDMARDARRDIMLLAVDTAGVISIYGSQDLCATWALVAS